ncbi:DNA repair exonuclease [Verrucomicrobiaceae bacterium 5K15]|uniref:DNA repair exonuclease n=1 Tax=Oceaniferula flava TaxID=2800421 RepID=A0AAE2SFQ9_9BACT|nr:DNA repair exonuclease [Oceaniferula flavus]MBK1855745.1 DNA repair exonuclease [Oceaniferula flavus]MBM1137052.1 DNA repair exonuclease [Oceaniferula flavus]
MFTFIHAADIHLDSPLTGLSQYQDAPVERIRNATRTALTNLVDLSIERQIDFLLIAGDLYNGDWKDYNTGLFFIREMRRLDEAGIPVYLISGNHDAESKITKALTLPDNVHHFKSGKAATVTVQGHPVSIHGQSFATPSVTENLAESYPAPVAEHFNIGLLHTNLGDQAGHGNYAPCTQQQLAQHGYDYWALGHIHKREVHQQSPHIVYSGNIQGRHAKETGPKGCYLVRVDADLQVQDFDFHALDTVRWHQTEIDCSDLTELDQLFDAIRTAFDDAIEKSGDRLAVVRVNLTGHTELHGTLHSEPSRIESECRLITEDLGLENIWVEKIKLKTKSKTKLADLAQRDDLVAMVIDALDHLDASQHPPAVTELRTKLPPEALRELQFDAPSKADRDALKDEVSAIVLHALTIAD